MNANYGLFPPLGRPLRGREKKLALAERALAALSRWREEAGLGGAGDGLGRVMPAARVAPALVASVIDVGSNSVAPAHRGDRRRRARAPA